MTGSPQLTEFLSLTFGEGDSHILHQEIKAALLDFADGIPPDGPSALALVRHVLCLFFEAGTSVVTRQMVRI